MLIYKTFSLLFSFKKGDINDDGAALKTEYVSVDVCPVQVFVSNIGNYNNIENLKTQNYYEEKNEPRIILLNDPFCVLSQL